MEADYTLHFLRPWWLLAFLPAAWFVWKLWHQAGKQGAWNQVIANHFKPILLGEKSEEQAIPWPIMGLAILWFLAITALSGPSWKQVEVPAEKHRHGSVVLLDLSLSMLADDLKPNRLSRAKYTLIDWLKAYPEINVGMVAYTGTAHTIAPISEDNQTLLNLIPSLTPEIMPAFGSDALKGFEKAIALLEGAKVNQGQILWVTDDVESLELTPLQNLIKQHDIQLHILAVGTPNGGPIQVPNYGLIKDDQGKIVLAKVPFQRFKTLAQKTGGKLTPLGMDQVNLQKLLPNTFYANASSKEQEGKQKANAEDKQLTTWLDEGLWLLVLILPLTALAYRRGWLLVMLLTTALPLQFWSEPTYAQTEEETRSVKLFDVFKSPDQQGFEKWQKGDYSTAADRFEDPNWKGSSLYRLQKFKEARQQFSQDKSARGRYNEGNAYAQMGDLENAKKQYEEALKLDPSLESAQHNLNAIEQFEKQQQPPQSSQNNNQNDSKQEKQQGQSDSQNQDNASEKQNPAESQKQQNQQNQQDNASNANQGKSNSESSEGQNSNGNNNTQNDLNQPYRAEHQSENPQAGDEQSQQAKSNQPDAKNAQQSKQTDSKEDAQGQTGRAGNTQDQALPKSTDEDDQPIGLADQDANKQQLDDGQNGSAKSSKRKALTEQEQARQNWLNQIPDDPSLFLKRKFEHQIQQNQQPVEPKKIW